jgi:head-tail adaptor
LLTAGDLASMRTTLNQSLPGTAVIQTSSLTPDGMGGGTTAWTASGTVACRLASMASSDEREVGDRISPDADWILTIPANTTITRNSRVTTGGVNYQVCAMRAPRSYEVSRRVELKEET